MLLTKRRCPFGDVATGPIKVQRPLDLQYQKQEQMQEQRLSPVAIKYQELSAHSDTFDFSLNPAVEYHTNVHPTDSYPHPHAILPHTHNTQEYQVVEQCTTSSPCNMCSSTSSDNIVCAHCIKPTCTFCVRQCQICYESFCTLCSLVNYEEKDDRTLCVPCDTDDRNRMR